MRLAVVSTFFSLGALALVPAVCSAQLISGDENRARRACIDEAERQGWDVTEVTAFRSHGNRAYDVELLAGRSGRRTDISCSWDGRRAVVREGEGPYAGNAAPRDDRDDRTRGRSGSSRDWPDERGRWQNGGSSAVDACELALLERLRAEGRRRGYDTAEAYVERQQTESASSDEQVLRGTGSYRFGSEGYRMMRFECRVDPRARRVIEAHYDLDDREPGPDDRYGNEPGAYGRRDDELGLGPRRTLTCESVGARERTCRAAIAGSVRVARRLGSVACIEGRDWWWQPDGITVTNGCRAEFEFEAGR